jgi:D-tyrosyl-tRNA(Tyr) deacylase
MKAVVQRVKSAQVTVSDEVRGRIDQGLVVFLGVGREDNPQDAEFLATKIAGLRIFSNSAGKFDLSVKDVNGRVLIVSQFTLYGDCRKGRRPSFTDAAPPEMAEELYEYFMDRMRREGLDVESGTFQAEMEVHLVNDGPVTILLDSQRGS